MSMVVESLETGNSGLHQLGFARYVRTLLDCGHTVEYKSYAYGSRTQFDPTDPVGSERKCPICSRRPRESRFPYYPTRRQIPNPRERVYEIERWALYGLCETLRAAGRQDRAEGEYSAFYELFGSR